MLFWRVKVGGGGLVRYDTYTTHVMMWWKIKSMSGSEFVAEQAVAALGAVEHDDGGMGKAGVLSGRVTDRV